MSAEELERVRNSVWVHLAQMKDRQDRYRSHKNGAAANALTSEMQEFLSLARRLGLVSHPLDVNLDSGVGNLTRPINLKNGKS